MGARAKNDPVYFGMLDRLFEYFKEQDAWDKASEELIREMRGNYNGIKAK